MIVPVFLTSLSLLTFGVGSQVLASSPPAIVAQVQLTLEEEERLTELDKCGRELYWRGHYVEAVECYEEALAIRKEIFGEEHPDVVTSLNKLAFLHYRSGNYAAAETLYKQAIAISKEEKDG